MLLHKFFSKVSKLYDTGVSPLILNRVKSFSQTDAKITSVSITISKVLRALGQLDVIKASEPDRIPNLIPSPVTSLYGKCFAAESFPKACKITQVVSVPKAEPKLTVWDRPISLLRCVGNVYESVINKNLNQYIEPHLFLADMQYGFHRNGLNWTV